MPPAARQPPHRGRLHSDRRGPSPPHPLAADAERKGSPVVYLLQPASPRQVRCDRLARRARLRGLAPGRSRTPQPRPPAIRCPRVSPPRPARRVLATDGSATPVDDQAVKATPHRLGRAAPAKPTLVVRSPFRPAQPGPESRDQLFAVRVASMRPRHRLTPSACTDPAPTLPGRRRADPYANSPEQMEDARTAVTFASTASFWMSRGAHTERLRLTASGSQPGRNRNPLPLSHHRRLRPAAG